MDPLDGVFRALADPSRRRLLDSLNGRNGQTLGELCAQIDMARQSVSKHLAVLEEANLVTTVRRGRQKLHFLNAEPINAISDRWIDRYHRERVHALADLKHALEEPMSRPEFVYTTYIRTTPERLWEAITNPVFGRRFMGIGFETDWNVGSPYIWTDEGLRIEDDARQRVLEYDPYRRLALTFHTFVPEIQAHTGLDDATFAAAAAEPRSTFAFDLEPQGDLVRLTVTHDGFEPGSTVLPMITQGWPHKLSTLKTGVESAEFAPAV